MLERRAGSGSDRLKSMQFYLHFRAVGGHGRSCMALKLVWRLVNRVSNDGPENGVVCIEVNQRIPSSKSNIIDIYREESRPENLTLWHPRRDCLRSGQQALLFDTLNSITEVVGDQARQSFEKPRLLSMPIRMW
jgi:hypothetical protein